MVRERGERRDGERMRSGAGNRRVVWWECVTDPAHVAGAVSQFARLWRAAVTQSRRLPKVGLEEALEWVGRFAHSTSWETVI